MNRLFALVILLLILLNTLILAMDRYPMPDSDQIIFN